MPPKKDPKVEPADFVKLLETEGFTFKTTETLKSHEPVIMHILKRAGNQIHLAQLQTPTMQVDRYRGGSAGFTCSRMHMSPPIVRGG
jgi:hypothetical protein